MPWAQFFQDGPEYEVRRHRTHFDPPDICLTELRDAVPKRLHKKSTLHSLGYFVRHLACTYALFRLGFLIDIFPRSGLYIWCIRPTFWILYWGWQGIAFAGLWCLGHEAGHHALSPYKPFNHLVGILVHTFMLTPYFSWRITHQNHHKSTNNLERDETYIPPTRRDLKLPDDEVAVRPDYTEVLEETPMYTLFKLFVRQFIGFQLYLMHNRKGNPRYPSGTSHYLPSSALFKPTHYKSIVVSNITILCMVALLATYVHRQGASALWTHYILPWLFAHNWIVLFTYLQHSDPTIPYYRKGQWTFARGALATVDRPLLGWVGRFFLHNISSDHIAHHFFPDIPFYNLPEVTKIIKPILGEYYNYDTTPAVYALWRSFTQCTFLESEGDILFFKNQYGKTLVHATNI